MADRKDQRRQEHQDLSRAQMLDAAEEVFGQKGYHRTTLKEVAAQAGFAVGSVYTMFESKDDLFRQVFERRSEEWLPQMWELLGNGAPRHEQLHDLVDLLVGFCRERPAFARLYLRYARPSAASSELFAETTRLQSELIARGQRARVFRKGDPDALSQLLTGLVTAFQAQDPRIIGDDSRDERLPLADLHDMVERAFVVSRA